MAIMPPNWSPLGNHPGLQDTPGDTYSYQQMYRQASTPIRGMNVWDSLNNAVRQAPMMTNRFPPGFFLGDLLRRRQVEMAKMKNTFNAGFKQSIAGLAEQVGSQKPYAKQESGGGLFG